jgi:hypothetical protein
MLATIFPVTWFFVTQSHPDWQPSTPEMMTIAVPFHPYAQSLTLLL